MTLSEKQAVFSANFARLILWANKQPGVRVRVDGAARSRSQQILYCTGNDVILEDGKAALQYSGKIRSKTFRSKHLSRLAADLILDIQSTISNAGTALNNNRYQYQTRTEEYKFLGDYWKSLHLNNVWGGDFKGFPDGNHFEMK